MNSLKMLRDEFPAHANCQPDVLDEDLAVFDGFPTKFLEFWRIHGDRMFAERSGGVAAEWPCVKLG